MKNYKKILSGAVIAALSGVLVFILNPLISYAAINPSSWDTASYTLTNESTLEIKVDNKTFRFSKDTAITEARVYKPNNPPANNFCGNSTVRIETADYNAQTVRLEGFAKIQYLPNASTPTLCPTYESDVTITNRAAQHTGPITFEGTTYSPVPSGSNPTAHYGSGFTTKADNCYNGSVLILDSPGSRSGTAYEIGSNPLAGAVTNRKLSNIAASFPGGNNCYVLDLGQPISINSSGKAAAVNPGGVDEEDTSDCFANSHTSLEWILCPISTALSKAVDSINKLIESQLNFNVKENLADNGGIHKAWAIIKNVVTAMVVIIMLVVIISQALGTGIFEAYTVKKILPRLVIAVIAMQLSWQIGKFFIGLANDAGQGIGQLIAAPFGGMGNLDLNSILHELDPAWGLGTQVIIPTLLLGGVIVAFITLPGTLVAIFGLFIGVLAAFMVLLFRNVLIISLVIFLPLALLLWILPNPGMQKYWKLWSDNFVKLLMLFPLIMAIIYTGRAFAFVVAGTNNDVEAAFIDYVTILVAYFGPYFIIFKAYRWGGSMLSAGGSAIASGRKAITNANAPWLKTQGERWQGKMADKYAIADFKGRGQYVGFQKRRERIASLREGLEKLKKDPTANADKIAKHERALDKFEKQNEAQKAQIEQDMKDNGRLKRGWLRVAAGKPLPTSRQQLETIAKGSAYKKELVEQKHALIHTDFVEQLNSGASVGDAKKYIRDKYFSNNLLRDENGNIALDENGYAKGAKDTYTERAFYNWLVDTKSAQELGDEDWRTDGGKIPDLIKTKGFMGMMNADPQRYGYISSNYSVMQPFKQDLGGGPKRVDYRPAVKDIAGNVVIPAGRRAEVDAVSATDYMSGGLHANLNPSNDPAKAIELAEAESKEIGKLMAEDARMVQWQKQMENPRQLATERGENFKFIDDIQRGLRERGLESKARAELEETFTRLRDQKTPESQSILSSMMGGERAARGYINHIFADQSKRYLEDLLNLPARGPVVDKAGGVIASLPTPYRLADEGALRDFRNSIISVPFERNPVAQQLARAFSELKGYSEAAHGTDQRELERVFDQVIQSSATSVEATRNTNRIIDEVITNLKNRVARAQKTAIAQHKTPDEVRTITEQAMTAAYGPIDPVTGQRTGGEIARWEAKRRDLPDDDPTVLQVPHQQPGQQPQGPIITPGQPGFPAGPGHPNWPGNNPQNPTP